MPFTMPTGLHRRARSPYAVGLRQQARVRAGREPGPRAGDAARSARGAEGRHGRTGCCCDVFRGFTRGVAYGMTRFLRL